MKRKTITLRFANLNDATQYLRTLEKVTPESTGNWSLYEIYSHCALAFECSMTKFPKMYPRLIQTTLGRLSFLGLRVLDGFPPSVPNVRAIPPVGGQASAKDGFVRLIGALEKFSEHKGPWAAHSFFGELTGAEWAELHTWHLANHLAYIKSPNQREEGTGQTPLIRAILDDQRESETVLELLSRGANPDLPDARGLTPLHHCVLEGKIELLRILLEAGASPNVQDVEGVTCLNLTRSLGGSAEFTELLIQHGGDLSIVDHKGKTYQM